MIYIIYISYNPYIYMGSQFYINIYIYSLYKYIYHKPLYSSSDISKYVYIWRIHLRVFNQYNYLPIIVINAYTLNEICLKKSIFNSKKLPKGFFISLVLLYIGLKSDLIIKYVHLWKRLSWVAILPAE